MSSQLLWLLGGFVIGGAIIWLLTRLQLEKVKKNTNDGIKNRIDELTIEKTKYIERTQQLEEQLKELKDEFGVKEGSLSDSLQQLSVARTENSHLKEKLETQKTELLEVQKIFRESFENLANRILDEKSKKFTEANSANIGQILKPLGEKIKEFQERVEKTYVEESQQRFSLEKEIKRLYELNIQVTRETNNLTNALKGEAKTQGNWGEMILETILEKSGLIKGTHFSVQQSITAEDGSRMQPDVLIHLPENKNMIVDSKVSLTAYERFYSAGDNDEKKLALAQHIASIKMHVRELSDKNYQNLYNINSPDFVLMFLPVEPAFGLAVLNDADLFFEAFNRNVVIVSPSTLLATLRTVSSIWRFENQNKNAVKIAEQSGKLYDKFVAFVEDLQEIGKKIGDTQHSYENALSKLQSGTGNLIKRAEDIRKLGAKTCKRLPARIVDEIERNDTPVIENCGEDV